MDTAAELEPTFVDREGNVITEAEAYALRKRGFEYTRIAHDERDDVIVSTIWTGHDPLYGYREPPHVFETMIRGGPRYGETWEWVTEADARAGHAEICSGLFRA